MSRNTILSLFTVVTILTLTSCATKQEPTTPVPNMANPASVYCEEQGGRLEIRQDTGGEIGMCIFPDGSECEEWAYYRNECAPAGSTPTEAPAPVSNALPTPMPIHPDDYQGWSTYTHPEYGFSLLLPSDWVVDEPMSTSVLDGHLLLIHPQDDLSAQNIRVTFRRVGENVLLWPTGVGEGEFVEQDTLEIDGAPARRIVLVCPNGQVDSIRYQGESDPNLLRVNMEFAFLFNASDTHCKEGSTLNGKTQLVGEMIIASLEMPQQ